MLYIISVALQLSGSVLGIGTFGLTRKHAIKEFRVISTYMRKNGDSKKINYSKKAFLKNWEKMYERLVVFGYLSVGYLLTPIAEKSFSSIITLLFVVLLSIFLVIIGKLIPSFTIKHLKTSKARITYEELTQLGLEVDMESLPSDEIENILYEK